MAVRDERREHVTFGSGQETIPRREGNGWAFDEIDTLNGDIDAAFANAAVSLDQLYLTPYRHHNVMEPSATLAECSLANASLAGATFVDVELRGCDLAAVGNPERLRGVRMPWADVIESAGVLAEALGIQVVD